MSLPLPLSGPLSLSIDDAPVDDLVASSLTDDAQRPAPAEAATDDPRCVHLTGLQHEGCRCDGPELRLEPSFARGVFSNTSGPVRLLAGELHGGLSTVSGPIDAANCRIHNNGMALASVVSVRGDVRLAGADVIGDVVCGGALDMTDTVLWGDVQAGSVRRMARVRLAGELRATRPLVLGPDAHIDRLRLEPPVGVASAAMLRGTDSGPWLVTVLPGSTIGAVLPPPQGCELRLLGDAQYVGPRDEQLLIRRGAAGASPGSPASRAAAHEAMACVAPARAHADRRLRLRQLQAFVPGLDAGGKFSPAYLDRTLQRALALPDSPHNRAFAVDSFHAAGQRLLVDLRNGGERRDEVLHHFAGLSASSYGAMVAALLIGSLDHLDPDLGLNDDLRELTHWGRYEPAPVTAALQRLGMAEGPDSVLSRHRHRASSWITGALLSGLGMIDAPRVSPPPPAGCRIA